MGGVREKEAENWGSGESGNEMRRIVYFFIKIYDYAGFLAAICAFMVFFGVDWLQDRFFGSRGGGGRAGRPGSHG
jgi:hypothetical protein